MTTLREAAQQALGALENAEDQLAKPYSTDASKAITALRAALAEPVQEPTVPSDCTDSHQPVQEPLSIERLRDALVASRIIPTAAVEDPDEYDDGVTLFRIEALHRRIKTPLYTAPLKTSTLITPRGSLGEEV